MTTYLLSVIHPDGVTDEWKPSHLTDEEIQQSFADTGAFNEEIRASGHWVFAGGLEPPTNATVVDNVKGENVITAEQLLKASPKPGEAFFIAPRHARGDGQLDTPWIFRSWTD